MNIFSLASERRIEKIKSEPEIAKKTFRFALLSILFACVTFAFAGVAFAISFIDLTTSSFWIRFTCVSLAFLAWAYSLSGSFIQLSINKSTFSVIAFAICISSLCFVVVATLF